MAVVGFLSVDVLVRPVSELNEIVLMTKWESESSIRQFSGQDISMAKVEPEARVYLRSFDTEVTHFSIVLETKAAALEE
jgi:heme-degrading monooxygenase HmoA